MRSIIVVLLFIVPVMRVSAQSPRNVNVPDNVVKSFNKRFPMAKDVSWDKVDTTYKADFYYKERLSYAEFDIRGEWVKTIIDQDIYDLYPPVERYISENFGKYKLLFVEKVLKADKNDYYYAQLSKKVKGQNEPVIVEIFFDKTGRVDQVKMPEGVDDMAPPGVVEPETIVPASVTDAFKNRFPRAEDLSWTTVINPSDSIDFNFLARFFYRDKPTKAEFLPDGKWHQTSERLDEKTLYSPILRYLAENYGKSTILLAEKVTRADKNDFYHVKLEKEEHFTEDPLIFDLYFDKAGKIQEVKRPEISKNQYLLTVDIPEIIGRKFNSRFARAADVTWEKEDTIYTANFIYRESPTIATYTQSGAWIETLQSLDTKNMYAPIDRYLDANYKEYKVNYAEKATRSDRKDYYYVELFSKKKSVKPQQLTLYFDRTGKPIEKTE